MGRIQSSVNTLALHKIIGATCSRRLDLSSTHGAPIELPSLLKAPGMYNMHHTHSSRATVHLINRGASTPTGPPVASSARMDQCGAIARCKCTRGRLLTCKVRALAC